MVIHPINTLTGIVEKIVKTIVEGVDKTTDREIMETYIKDENGNMVQLNLHYSKQKGSCPLSEINSKTHQNPTNKEALHPYGKEKNPNDPVDRKAFYKDRNQYWENRLKELEKGRRIMLTPNTKFFLYKNLKFCFENTYNNQTNDFLELSQNDLTWYLNTFNMKDNRVFMEYYNIVDFPPIGKGEELFTLDQIIENYQYQCWLNLFPEGKLLKEKYPKAGERFIQISSIEGEGSYFYDKENDAVYDVDWGEEENMITGKLKPLFNSFYDFLEWYYSEEE